VAIVRVDSLFPLAVLGIKLGDEPVVIGRHENCDFILDGPTVSNVHCRIWAFDSGTGEILVCCEVRPNREERRAMALQV
jgi:hypothetical protein